MGQCGVTDLFTECRKVTTVNNLNILERVRESVNVFIVPLYLPFCVEESPMCQLSERNLFNTWYYFFN